MKITAINITQLKLPNLAIKLFTGVRFLGLLVAILSAFASHSLYAQSLTEQLERGLGLAPAPETAVATKQQDSQENLADDIETLKQSMVNLNRDLFILEEDLLFPSSTQVAIYLSMDVGEYFGLDTVEIRVNDVVKTHFLYTERQVNALFRGGVQRLYVGNVNQGEHELTAYFIGTGPEDREYKRAVSVSFTKDEDPVAVELSVIDSSKKQQPMFEATVL